MVIGYWSVAILFWQLSIDHIVSVIYKRWGLAKTRLRHPSLPFDSLPYRTRTICRRVRTYVRSVSHVTTKRKGVDHIPWVWGSVPRALRARGSPAIIVLDNQSPANAWSAPLRNEASKSFSQSEKLRSSIFNNLIIFCKGKSTVLYLAAF